MIGKCFDGEILLISIVSSYFFQLLKKRLLFIDMGKVIILIYKKLIIMGKITL